MKLSTLILLLCCALPSWALTNVERTSIWTRAHDAIRYQYTGFDDRQLAAWDENYEARLKQLVSAPSDVEFWRSFRQLVANLGDGRTYVQIPNGLPRAYDAVPIRLIFAGSKILVGNLSSSPDVQSSGIHAGDELISVDNVAAMDYLSRECVPHVSGSTLAQKQAEAVLRMLTGIADSRAQLVFHRPNGTEYSVKLNRNSGPDSKYLRELTKQDEQFTKSFPGHTVCFHIGQRFTANAEQAILDQLDADPKIQNVILDLRETKYGSNPGSLLRRFAFFPIPTGTYQEVDWTTTHDPKDPVSVVTTRSKRVVQEAMKEPSEKTFRGKVVALVSSETAGPAEQFLEPLIFADRVVLIGDTTAGAGGETIELSFGEGAKLYVTAREPKWENGYGNGRGFPPRVYAEPTAKGLSAGKDEVLNRAVEFINESAN